MIVSTANVRIGQLQWFLSDFPSKFAQLVVFYLFWSKYNRPLCVMPIFTVCYNVYATYNVLFKLNTLFSLLLTLTMCLFGLVSEQIECKRRRANILIFTAGSNHLNWFYFLLAMCFAVDFPVLTIEWMALVGPDFAQISAFHHLPFYLFIR